MRPGNRSGYPPIGYQFRVTPDALLESYRSVFSANPTHRAVAPGRVNLIGEHTDYNEGFVFPAAIDRTVSIAARVADGPSRLKSMQKRDVSEFSTKDVHPKNVAGWAAYAAGVAWSLKQRTGITVPNIEAIVQSTVPLGSGVSSSAALELAFASLWNDLADLGLSNKDLAFVCQTAENRYVGVNCGIMDQMASAMGKADTAMFMDTRSMEIDYVSIDPEWAIVVCDTKKPRALTDSAYNERRSQCEEAARLLGIPSLRDATTHSLAQLRGIASDVVFRRARHVITENERCREFRSGLASQDIERVRGLMAESHQSLQKDYEVSCEELDLMVDACRSAPGFIGSRMTGAGFGGCCVALAQVRLASEFCDSAQTAYRNSTGREGSLFVCRAVEGAKSFNV
jgi:galactokinase